MIGKAVEGGVRERERGDEGKEARNEGGEENQGGRKKKTNKTPNMFSNR